MEAVGNLVAGFFNMCIIACLLGFPVMWLWNYTCPQIFGLPEVDFFHALALNNLAGALFGKNGGYSKSKKE